MGVTSYRTLGTKTVPKLLEKVNIIDIINDVITGGTGVPLSAEAGKGLNVKINVETTARQQALIDLIGGANIAYDTLSKIEGVIIANELARDASATADTATLETALTTEVANRIAGDSALSLSLSQNVATLNSAIANEASARSGADTILTDDLAQEVLDRQTAITNEATARINADSAEQTRAIGVEATLNTALLNETTRATTAEGTLQTNIDAEQARATGVEGVLNTAINNERDQRVNADLGHENRLAAIENGLIAGIVWRASLADLIAVDALVEADVVLGWAYYIGVEKDVYVVVDGTGGDYRPSTWTATVGAKSFLKFADFAEVTGMISAETTRATTAETALAGDIQTETTRATTAEGILTTSINNEITRATGAEATLQSNITAEATARIADVDAEEARATAEEARIAGLLSQEVTDRGTAVTNERTRAEGEEARIEGLVNAEVLDRATAVTAEATARTNADNLISANLATEVTNRTNATATEVTNRTTADNILSGRLDIVEGANTVVGSIKKALLDANQVTYDNILVPKVQGLGGTLLVVGDTITVNHVIADGINGIVFGEVVVYLNGTSEAVAVNVASVTGSVITLAVSVVDEYAGMPVKVNYFSRALLDTGAGTGVAGAGLAGA